MNLPPYDTWKDDDVDETADETTDWSEGCYKKNIEVLVKVPASQPPCDGQESVVHEQGCSARPTEASKWDVCERYRGFWKGAEIYVFVRWTNPWGSVIPHRQKGNEYSRLDVVRAYLFDGFAFNPVRRVRMVLSFSKHLPRVNVATRESHRYDAALLLDGEVESSPVSLRSLVDGVRKPWIESETISSINMKLDNFFDTLAVSLVAYSALDELSGVGEGEGHNAQLAAPLLRCKLGVESGDRATVPLCRGSSDGHVSLVDALQALPLLYNVSFACEARLGGVLQRGRTLPVGHAGSSIAAGRKLFAPAVWWRPDIDVAWGAGRAIAYAAARYVIEHRARWTRRLYAIGGSHVRFAVNRLAVRLATYDFRRNAGRFLLTCAACLFSSHHLTEFLGVGEKTDEYEAFDVPNHRIGYADCVIEFSDYVHDIKKIVAYLGTGHLEYTTHGFHKMGVVPPVHLNWDYVIVAPLPRTGGIKEHDFNGPVKSPIMHELRAPLGGDGVGRHAVIENGQADEHPPSGSLIALVYTLYTIARHCYARRGKIRSKFKP